MKRLFQISLDTLLTSLLPIIMWIVLGVVINKDISNVFSLTYPLQFFYMIFTCIFAIGPNITSKKLKNKNIVFSNMFLGVIFVGIITLLLVVNANLYISTMNMDKEIYHNFCIYAMLWLYISFILQIIIQKLYYENKNKEANKTSILINITNFVLIILFSYLYKDYVAIFITLIVDFTLILFCLYKNFKSYSLNIDFKIGENIKYTSFSILKNIGMFLVYGIGFGNSFSYGNEYISAINFESLTTDTHWDILESVDTASKIDLAENRFDYKKSLKNAYKLLAILIASIILMI